MRTSLRLLLSCWAEHVSGLQTARQPATAHCPMIPHHHQLEWMRHTAHLPAVVQAARAARGPRYALKGRKALP